MIRYLTENEKGKCRALWREAFPEDSEEFLEYYFKWKTADNRVLVKEDETGRILSMAHRNPYRVMVKGQPLELDYIVGVATAADSRHQGHMREILEKMLRDIHESGAPFCYLMPAFKELYLPFGFRFVFDQPLWQMKKELPGGVRREEVAPADFSGLGCWMNRWLDERFQVYGARDKAYMDRLGAELDSGDGRVYGWYDGDGGLKALQAFWGGEKRERRFLYSSEPDWVETEGADAPSGDKGREEGGSRPAIMARITNAAAMMKSICLTGEAPCEEIQVLVRIRDELIPGNHGLWRWKLNRRDSELTREPLGLAGAPLFSTEVLEIDVASLASWLLGYDGLERLLGETGEMPPWWCRFAEPLGPVFLDEIV